MLTSEGESSQLQAGAAPAIIKSSQAGPYSHMDGAATQLQRHMDKLSASSHYQEPVQSSATSATPTPPHPAGRHTLPSAPSSSGSSGPGVKILPQPSWRSQEIDQQD